MNLYRVLYEGNPARFYGTLAEKIGNLCVCEYTTVG